MSKRTYHGYTLYCPDHGIRQAGWAIDVPKKLSVRVLEVDSFNRQLESMTLPTHARCRTITIEAVHSAASTEALNHAMDKEGERLKEVI